MKKLILCCFLFASIILSSLIAGGYTNDECIECHGKFSEKSNLTISVENYLKSVHGNEMGCLDCHKSIVDQTHEKISGTGSVDCSNCHEQDSEHGLDNKFPCYQCHTRHEIYPATEELSSVYWKNLKTTCGKCHPQECENKRPLDFFSSLYISSHSKQTFAENFDKGMCVDCHQGKAVHGEKSPVSSKQCNKCHNSLGQNEAALGYIHTKAEWDSQPVSLLAGYMNMAGLVLLLFSGGIAVFGKKKR